MGGRKAGRLTAEPQPALTCYRDQRRRKHGPQAWEWPSPSTERRRVVSASDPPAFQAPPPHRLLMRGRKRITVRINKMLTGVLLP